MRHSMNGVKRDGSVPFTPICFPDITGTALQKATAAVADVTTLEATVGINTGNITTTQEAVSGPTGVLTKYGVKVSSNGYVSGF